MISVVIPLYNKAHTIERTLGSVLKQTFQAFEVVIINDGSTDNGLKVINDFTRDERVKVFSQVNKGVSAARNFGVENAQFKYIAFLDGDDEWLPDYLQKMAETIHKFPEAGMICGAGIVRDSQGDHLRLADKYKSKFVSINYFHNPHVFTHTSATIVKKQAFEKAGGFPVGMKRNQDFAFFFTVGLNENVAYCGFPLSIYVGDVDGQTTTTPIEKVIQHIINRFNHVHKSHTDKHSQKSYLVFTKYELRHYMYNFISQNNFTLLKEFAANLDKSLIGCFNPLEIRIYKTRSLKKLSKIILLFHKFRWRLRAYPRVK